MRIESKQLFEQLEPPAGGLERLRQKLAAPELDHGPNLWRPIMATAMLLLAAIWLYQLPEPQEASTPVANDLFNAASFDRLLGRESRTAGLQVVRADQAVPMVEVEGTGANVHFYRLNPSG
jgi:hypothetical protein